jgi:Uma2 family endonuclease
MNAPALPKVRMTVAQFLEWSQRQPDDRYELVEGRIVAMTPDSVRHNQIKAAAWRAVASIRHYLIVVSEKRVVLHHERNDRGTIDTRIMHEGDITLDPPGITVTVAALLGPASTTATGEAS